MLMDSKAPTGFFTFAVVSFNKKSKMNNVFLKSESIYDSYEDQLVSNNDLQNSSSMLIYPSNATDIVSIKSSAHKYFKSDQTMYQLLSIKKSGSDESQMQLFKLKITEKAELLNSYGITQKDINQMNLLNADSWAHYIYFLTYNTT